ncbi:hypothetical protein PSTG_15578 [Puccinia striiformis f. sp. tritici PST-78]|uniref:FAD-binding domain-containing protein n=1 Tax=Puccinia striiformis f. sp. tritici PST-78 TaxID=1165861 RepID=A0A0L0UWC0_9BASI|nr:hypothetical protein PSTG_15578 [Puccinia striiformis f. sp. tritici PST-78]
MDMNFKSPVETTDVLIVGAGPAGLMASLCLHTFGLSVLHIDNRPEPTSAGRADGIQPRTLEVLRNIGPWIPPKNSSSPELHLAGPSSGNSTLGIAKNLVARGVRVYEVSFWDPTPDKQLARTSRARSCPDFIDVRDRYTLLLHQGIIEREFLAEISARAPNSQVLRPFEFVNCRYHASGKEPTDYPIEVTVRSADGTEKLVRTKYLLGCDGAKSDVRKSLGGAIRLEGEKTHIVWGVMDCWVQSDFPDLKLKCLIHSRNDGSIMVIPRENNLVRFYVQLVNGDSECDKDTATLENCQEQARKIFHPYTLKFGDTDWFSIYKIGQQIANAYTLDGRIILGGDAVHTHSPKAGQGMNISMLDMYSLAWKINLVEKGIGQREKIMETYEQERRGVAQELMAFDSEYSKLFSGRGSKIGSSKDKTRATNNLEVDPQRFIELFKQNAYFTSGCGAVYPSNVFNARADSHIFKSHIDCRIDGPLRAGERLLPGDAIRVIDGNPVRIEQEVRMDGAFRIYIFLGASPVGSRLDYLNESCCFLKRFRATTGQRCSVFDPQRAGPNPFFTFLLVTSRSRDEWDIADLPPLFSGPYASQVYVDLIENTVAGPRSTKTCSLHSKYGFDEGEGGGGIIIVRPDGYVGSVVSFCETGWKAVERYFEGFLVESGV